MNALRSASGCLPSTSGRPCEPVAAGRCVNAGFQQRRVAPAARHDCWRQRRRGVAAAAADKPEWFRNLEDSAGMDEAAARLLAGSNGDPQVVQRRMREEMDAIQSRILGTKYGGEEAPMDVSFRNPVDNFSLWLWLELYKPPSGSDLELLQEVLNSWYLLGRLGAFNSVNLQVLYHQDGDLEDLEYDAEEGTSLPATFHDMAPLESQGTWARFWVDMGTADELALDMLINALSTFSKEQLGIKQLVVGGENDDWAAPQRDEFLPEVTMDPMRGPRRFGGEEDEDTDEEDEDEDEDEGEEVLP